MLGGESAKIVMHTVRNVLLPLAAFNYAVDKAKRYFEDKFESDLEAKLEGIPAEDLVEPKASVVGPAIQGLAYSFEEAELRDLYLNLLRSSMDEKTSSVVHPSFVEIVKQLTAREAQLLALLGRNGAVDPHLAVIQVKAVVNEPVEGFIVLLEHLMDIDLAFNDEEVEIQEIAKAVENWVRLGLFTVTYSSFLTEESSYAWENDLPGLAELRATHASVNRKIEFTHGLLRITALGQDFFSAVVLAPAK